MAFKPKSSKPTKTITDIISPEEDEFIGSAKADTLEAPPIQPTQSTAHKKQTPTTTTPKMVADAVEHDLHVHVRKQEWPISQLIMPSMADGRTDLDKPLLFRMPETVWLSIDRHCKALGVSKSEWIRHAILKLMREEQEFFSSNQ